jgi:F0F1-type ATP synthase epsilon subunit
MATPKTFKVKVRDTENIIFEGDIDRISSFNEVGPFDIYPMHANFISIIRQELALYKGHEKVKELKFEQAVMKVKQDVAQIFLGIEVLFVDKELTGAKSS